MNTTKRVSLFLTLALLVTLALPFVSAKAQDGGLLATVKARGKVICGVNPGIPGFGYLDSADNTFKGFDPSFCRALAAAIFGDTEAVEWRPIARAADRFPSLASGDIDVLIRNTTFTAGRDTAEGADFAPTTFYDASTVLVRTADSLMTLESLKDLTICAIKGTTNERAIGEAMAAAGATFTLVTYDDIDAVLDAFSANRCDAVTSDRSQLAGKRSSNANGGDWTIWDANLTKEPLGPVVKAGDSQWLDVVRWTVYATIIAEEKGITSTNIDDVLATTKDPETLRLFGKDGELYKALGLEANWAYNIIKNVGNYGEIFDSTVGEGSPLGLPRGLNALWLNGGLQYAPPYR
ncbi:MAG TPA: amino acid ABC transporter substrate-binding protein [Aggregatilineales bacterium]|nr:amino acid ABC transporter substrate-binding protein [Anaerolineales bacterium]HRE46833.1 amino acid ABC transporter substrate-binding protein [Aggregatilineales bacterium]